MVISPLKDFVIVISEREEEDGSRRAGLKQQWVNRRGKGGMGRRVGVHWDPAAPTQPHSSTR